MGGEAALLTAGDEARLELTRPAGSLPGSGRSTGACFAVEDGRLVAAGAGKAVCAYRWAVGWGGRAEEEQEEWGSGEGASEQGQGQSRRTKARRRMAKTQQRLPCRLANR